ncbi:MAG: GAF domain-containing protein [bacterium]
MTQKNVENSQEQDRLNIVKTLNILDTKPEERFDNITKTALEKFQVPISTITIIDSDREWFKSQQGLKQTQGPRDISFCGHALLAEDMFIVEDTFLDSRFINNPYVKAHPPIRFYAGISLRHKKTGLPIGVFCLKDYKPRKMTTSELDTFLELAKEAEYQLNVEHSKNRYL